MATSTRYQSNVHKNFTFAQSFMSAGIWLDDNKIAKLSFPLNLEIDNEQRRLMIEGIIGILASHYAEWQHYPVVSTSWSDDDIEKHYFSDK